MPRSVGINGGGFDSRSTHDNMVYQASRLPQSFDASAMPMTHTALHHMRAGLGVEEQMEFIASSGFHCEPGTNAANLVFSKRGRFNGFLGAVGATGRVEGKTRDLIGIRSAVTEALALLRKIARGFVAHPFYFTPARQFEAKAKTPNTNARTSVEGNQLQPLATDLAYRADIRGEAVGRTRRVSTTSAAINHRPTLSSLAAALKYPLFPACLPAPPAAASRLPRLLRGGSDSCTGKLAGSTGHSAVSLIAAPPNERANARARRAARGGGRTHAGG